MTRKNQSITLSLPDREKTQLESLALELGYMWGDRPNISKLIKAIANGEIRTAANNDWRVERIDILNRARHSLMDAGQLEAATAIAQLLLERSELNIPLKVELETFLNTPLQAWRLEINQYIRRQQPFQLAYQDATGQIWDFTVRYATITTHEKRQYIDCWCEETNENSDFPELVHNWCLRLDRIQNASVHPLKIKWRANLDHIPVEIHLYRGLAFAYESKQNQDVANDWLSDSSQTRHVIRHVTNPFWFMREILQYGKDCKIISPDSMRNYFKNELHLLCQNYDFNYFS